MAHKGRKRCRVRLDRKQYVPRHRMMGAKGADAVERAIETTERRDARREIEEQLEDERSRAEQGTWNAIDSWWGA